MGLISGQSSPQIRVLAFGDSGLVSLGLWGFFGVLDPEDSRGAGIVQGSISGVPLSLFGGL